jgi:uncharacterized 2Fe-2S/4Fe-4S cluster protein (DUF4445 family)
MAGMEGAISAYEGTGDHPANGYGEGSREGKRYHVIGDMPPAGICGSGLIDIVAFLVETGKVAPDGMLKEDFVIVTGPESQTGEEISITQQDIREVQLAKSAIAAGVKILLNRAGIGYGDIDAVYLAGGFGNYINPESAMKIGLISPEFNGKIIPLGNTSGTGTVLAVKSTRFDDVIESLLNRTRYLELSGNDEFTVEFAMNMNF